MLAGGSAHMAARRCYRLQAGWRRPGSAGLRDRPSAFLWASCPAFPLAAPIPTCGCMFAVDEATAEAIRRAYDEGGELSGIVEFRRHFPLITDNAKAAECVRIIAGWTPGPAQGEPSG